MYKLIIRPVFFLFDPEKIHKVSLLLLRVLFAIPGAKSIARSIFKVNHPALKRKVMGIEFDNPVGLAAGFDKEAQMIDVLEPLGFGSIEIGTITPKGQPGNDKPRVFRLPKDKALINRMGFNNKGVAEAVSLLTQRKSSIIVGGNIGKNKITPNEEAISDYEYCFEALHAHVDYFVVNVSSPNTPNLRELQSKEPLKELLNRLQERNQEKNIRKPILLKIAPDVTDGQLEDIVEIVRGTGIAGIIATNTTISRDNLTSDEHKIESIGAGGLSGGPLTDRATEVIGYLRQALGESVCIIGVGGIMSPQDAIDKMRAGADLIQIYTGFIYEGPALIKNINKAILKAGL